MSDRPPADSPEGREVQAHTGRAHFVADCLNCGWVSHEASSPHREASRHASANVGHAVHLTMECVRVYRAAGVS